EFLLDLIPRVWLEVAMPERNFLCLFGHAQNSGFDFLADTENIRRTHDAFRPREFCYVNQNLYAFLDLNTSTVGDKIRDLTFNSLSGGETLLDLVPRVLLCLLESERNALLFLVDVEHNDFQLLPDFQ